MTEFPGAGGTEPTLYDVLAAPTPESMEHGETRITREAPETTDEYSDAVFPGLGVDA